MTKENHKKIMTICNSIEKLISEIISFPQEKFDDKMIELFKSCALENMSLKDINKIKSELDFRAICLPLKTDSKIIEGYENAATIIDAEYKLCKQQTKLSDFHSPVNVK